MDKEHFKIINDNVDDKLIRAYARGGIDLDLSQIVTELNSLEEQRRRKNEEIEKLHWEHNQLYDIVDGIVAYIKLKSKGWVE